MTDELKQWEYDRGYAKGKADALEKIRAELEEIREAVWDVDIPSPTVPEYIEHHKQMQSILALIDSKIKEAEDGIGGDTT